MTINVNGKGYVYCLYNSQHLKTIVKIGHCIARLPHERMEEYNDRYGTRFDCYRYWATPPDKKIVVKYERLLQGLFDKFDKRELYLVDAETACLEGDGLFERDFPELNCGISNRRLYRPKKRVIYHQA